MNQTNISNIHVTRCPTSGTSNQKEVLNLEEGLKYFLAKRKRNFESILLNLKPAEYVVCNFRRYIGHLIQIPEKDRIFSEVFVIIVLYYAYDFHNFSSPLFYLQ